MILKQVWKTRMMLKPIPCQRSSRSSSLRFEPTGCNLMLGCNTGHPQLEAFVAKQGYNAVQKDDLCRAGNGLFRIPTSPSA